MRLVYSDIRVLAKSRTKRLGIKRAPRRDAARRKSLPEHHSNSSPPFFIQSNPRELNFGRQIFQNDFGSRVESQRRRHQPNQRRTRIKLDSREISVTLKIPALEMLPHTQPVIHSLHRQLNILRSLQLDDHQPPVQRDSQQINYAAIRGGECRHLRVKKSRVQLRVKLRRVSLNQSFNPAFRRGAIERMIALVRKRIAMQIKLLQQSFHARRAQRPSFEASI